MFATSILIYVLAAVAEIAGCFAIWVWLRLDRSAWWLLPGLASLALFAWALTRVDVEFAGRAYAAYGGIYIICSILWLMWAEGQTPTRWDLLGAGLSLAGALVILAGSRA